MTDQIMILTIAVTLAFALGMFTERTRRRRRRKRRAQSEIDWMRPYPVQGNFHPVSGGEDFDPTKPPPFPMGGSAGERAPLKVEITRRR